MIHTLRAPLTAGTVAAVTAAALISAPADNADRLLASLAVPSSNLVALSAWQDPIVALLDSGELAENYVFGRYWNFGKDGGALNWPYAGFDQNGGQVLNAGLYYTRELGSYFYVGFLPNFTAEAYLPAVQQFQLNVEDYVSVVLSGLNLAARELATGVWDLPAAALDTVQLAAAGQFAEALTVITDAIIGPIVAAAQSVLDAGSYVVSNVVTKAGAVVAALPQILTTFAGSAIGGASILAQQIAAITTGVVSDLSTLNFEGAWNAAVDGLLGPSGIPGTLLNLTTGAGVQTGPIVDTTDIPANFVPSFRTAVQAAQWTIRSALATEPVAAASSASVARATTRLAEPTPTTAVEDETSTAAVDSPSAADTADTAAPDRKAAKRNRASRTAANRTGN